MTAAGEAATVESVNALRSRIDALTRNVEAAEQDGSSVTTRIDEKLARLEAKISAAASERPSQDTISDRVNYASIETGIDSIRSKLNSVEKRNADSATTFEQAVRGLSSRMETVETRYKSEIASLQSTLSSLAQHVERALATGPANTRSPLPSEIGAHAVTLPPIQPILPVKPVVETTPVKHVVETPLAPPLIDDEPEFEPPSITEEFKLEEEAPPLPPPPMFGPQQEDDGIILAQPDDEPEPQPQRRDEFLAAARRAAQAATQGDAPGLPRNYVPEESALEDPLAAPIKKKRKSLPFVVWIILALAALFVTVVLILGITPRSGPKPDRPTTGTSIGELL
jgi:hypothetical protein